MSTKTVPVSKRGGSVKLGDSILEGTTSFDVDVDAAGIITLTPTVNISAAEYAKLLAAAGGNGASADPANPANL
jgi:hypothetical protein